MNENLVDYALLGGSGLRVSPLCLGTMTFGTEWGWGSPAQTARAILDRYLDAGGNFVDTADGYTNGTSESLLGGFLKGRRDRVVLATKFTFNAFPGDPNAGGNGRKNIMRAVEASLKRLQTDYVDLYWLHAWDTVTPVEEVMSSLDALVRAGKVRYIGLSDTPAWYLARAQTLAEWRGWEKVCALQLEYSLVERSIEREHMPAARRLGMGVCPWSPLAGGFLSGKYTRGRHGVKGVGRIATVQGSGHPAFGTFSDADWKVLEVLREVSRKLGRSMTQVALNWTARRPGVASTLIGATKPEQLDEDLAALDFELPPQYAQRLEEAGRPEAVFPYSFFKPEMQKMVSGGTTVRSSA
ncbi:MAG: aldo/keto reductase [Elusimicrobia bacterium]|nr:aldo/keto reductase [Elusimicrobiota bacterium]